MKLLKAAGVDIDAYKLWLRLILICMVEPRYFKLSREMKKISLKKWEFEIADSKWLKGSFIITGNSKTLSSNERVQLYDINHWL